MDSFEGLVRLVIEDKGFWTRQSHKVNLKKCEKRAIGKPSMPRPEIDLLAFDPVKSELLVLEVKSYLDSPGVPIELLEKSYSVPTGPYKLFTSSNYRNVVFSRLKADLVESQVIPGDVTLRLGLAAGKIKSGKQQEVASFFKENGWFFLGPSEIKSAVSAWSGSAYENNPYYITAKVVLR